MLAWVGKATYKIQLPEDSYIHLMFHVSFLKPSPGSNPVGNTLPPAAQEVQQMAEPIAIVSKRVIYKQKLPIN